jgi:hypothetical protein
MLTDAFASDLAAVGPDLDLADKEAVSGLSTEQATAALHSAVDGWSQDQEVALLVDLALADPFAPYELKTSPTDFRAALGYVVELLAQPACLTAQILDTRKEALQAHKSLPWRKIVTTGVIGTVLVATGGWILAPAIGSALGAAAGLSGAAATAHGLALLGGGSLAAGGAGMAGGLWLVAGGGTLLGGVAGGAGQALRQLGAGQARVELVKLQMTYRLHVVHGQMHLYKAQHIITQLEESRQELEEALEQERQLNDKNAARVREIQTILDAVEFAQSDVEGVEAA